MVDFFFFKIVVLCNKPGYAKVKIPSSAYFDYFLRVAVCIYVPGFLSESRKLAIAMQMNGLFCSVQNVCFLLNVFTYFQLFL